MLGIFTVTVSVFGRFTTSFRFVPAARPSCLLLLRWR